MNKEVTLSLEALDSTDIGLIRSWRNNWAVWRWCRQEDVISDAEQVAWFKAQSEDKTIRMYKVVATTDSKSGPIGVCGFTSISHLHRRAEFSLYLAPEMHGRGLGKVALSLLLTHGFNNLGLNVIYGETFDGNPAAKMFEDLGFQKDGTRRSFYWKDGRFIDAHLYSILTEDWRAHTSASSGRDLVGAASVASAYLAEPKRAGAGAVFTEPPPAVVSKISKKKRPTEEKSHS